MLSYDLGPAAPSPLQASVGELYNQGVERQREGGSHFRIAWKGSVGDSNHTTAQTTLVLDILNSLYASLVKELGGFERWVAM